MCSCGTSCGLGLLVCCITMLVCAAVGDGGRGWERSVRMLSNPPSPLPCLSFLGWNHGACFCSHSRAIDESLVAILLQMRIRGYARSCMRCIATCYRREINVICTQPFSSCLRAELLERCKSDIITLGALTYSHVLTAHVPTTSTGRAADQDIYGAAEQLGRYCRVPFAIDRHQVFTR